MSHSLNRRQFIKQTGSAALGLTMLSGFTRKAAPSDRLRVAHIGLGGMGTQHMKWFANLPEVEIDRSRRFKLTATFVEYWNEKTLTPLPVLRPTIGTLR